MTDAAGLYVLEVEGRTLLAHRARRGSRSPTTSWWPSCTPGQWRADPLAELAAGLGDAFDAGLGEATDGRLRLTEKGILLSNEVFQAFV